MDSSSERYMVDARGRRTAVVLPIEEYEELLQDIHDLSMIAERRDEPTIGSEELKKTLREKYEVGLSGEVYDTPCHLQPIFEAYRDGEFPQAEDICARHICLPVFATMTEEQAHYVIQALHQAIQEVSEK